MAAALTKIPKIPRIPKKVPDPKVEAIEEKEFSGELEGGSLWQVLRVEESLIRKILLQLDPVDLINLEKTCLLIRDLIVQNNVWKKKLFHEFSDLLSINLIREKLELVVFKANEIHTGDVVKNDHWCFKLKYVHCWNLELNWKKGQFLQSEDTSVPTRELISTDFTNNDEGGLFCHKNKGDVQLGFYDISNVIEVTATELVIIGVQKYPEDTQYTVCVKLVKKHSLEVLGQFFSEEIYGDEEQENSTNNSSHFEDRILYRFGSKVFVLKFQSDPPNICQMGILELPVVGEESGSEFVVLSQDYLGMRSDSIINLFHLDLSNLEMSWKKIWEIDNSNQTSFPKVKFGILYFDFPFAYVTKSNGLMEVWDATKDEIVKTVDYTELLNAEPHFRGRVLRIEKNQSQVCTSNDFGDIFVLEEKLLNCDKDDKALGYRVNYDGKVDDFQVDSTCLVVLKVAAQNSNVDFDVVVKLDFWPIFAGNFKLKISEPEEDKETPAKSKKRKAPSCSSGNYSSVKKHGVGNEYEDSDSDKDDNYDYKNDDVYDYGAAADDDHDQFYDDDNHDGGGDDYY